MKTLAVAVGVLLLAGLAGPENPFAGWGEKQVEAFSKKAKSQINATLGRWLVARKNLVHACTRCRKTGKVVVRGMGRGRSYVGQCPTCIGQGYYVSRDNFILVFWKFKSRHLGMVTWGATTSGRVVGVSTDEDGYWYAWYAEK